MMKSLRSCLVIFACSLVACTPQTASKDSEKSDNAATAAFGASSAAADDTKIALQAVDAWVEAQNKNKVDSYLDLYEAASFQGIKRTTSGTEQKYDFKAWKEERSRMFAPDVKVAADDRQVTTGKQNPTLGADVIEVRFTQRWQNPRYADHGPKVIRLRVKNGAARIIYEELVSTAAGWDDAAAAAKPVAIGKFIRARPDSVDRQGLDACAYVGGMGFACLEAWIAEKNPVVKRYMLRMSDSDARLAYDQWVAKDSNGVAHAEFADQCADSGPCGKTPNRSDDGYACLTKAEMAIQENNEMASKAAHARACECGGERAQIPVMGGFLACQGKTPERRGQNLSTAEANEIRACAECDAEKGPAACAKEIERLSKTDPGLARYIETVHISRCARP